MKIRVSLNRIDVEMFENWNQKSTHLPLRSQSPNLLTQVESGKMMEIE
jgi:hypothetical protein